jgi:hypothetical protein
MRQAASVTTNSVRVKELGIRPYFAGRALSCIRRAKRWAGTEASSANPPLLCVLGVSWWASNARPNITNFTSPPRKFRPSLVSPGFETTEAARLEDGLRAKLLRATADGCFSDWAVEATVQVGHAGKPIPIFRYSGRSASGCLFGWAAATCGTRSAFAAAAQTAGYGSRGTLNRLAA